MFREIIHQLPRIRGCQRVLVTADRLLGPTPMLSRHGIRILGYYSSSQDTTFLRKKSDNLALESQLGSLPADGVFIDCGANAGFYSALATRKIVSGLVLSIEPSHREYVRLLWAIKNNKHKCKWLSVNAAVGAEHCMIGIQTDVGHTGMNQVNKSVEFGQQCVMQTTIDSLVSDIVGPDRLISVVKVDVEGYEFEVLKGAVDTLSRKQILSIVVEITPIFLSKNGSSKEEIYSFLAAYGYHPKINSHEWQYDEVFQIRQ